MIACEDKRVRLDLYGSPCKREMLLKILALILILTMPCKKMDFLAVSYAKYGYFEQRMES